MYGFKRSPSPVPTEIQKEKSHKFADARLRNPAHTFQWATIDGQSYNHICQPSLTTMTGSHCAYCDLNDLGSGAEFTIDHFRPKSNHPRLSYIWINLYPACGNCQKSKKEETNKAAFRPDEPGYNFNDYFTVNGQTGKIEVIPTLNASLYVRAKATIDYYGLNDYGRPSARKTEQKKMVSIFEGDNPEGITLDDFSYRFMW